MNTYIVDSLNNILLTYQSIVAFFYQRIIQTQYTNNSLAVYVIDYNLLLPSSQYIFDLNENQVNAQVQEYINICNVLIIYINTNVNTQVNLFYEQIKNTLDNSITQLNGFSLTLLKAQYKSIFVYNVPYSMSLSNVLFLNNINVNTYPVQARLNAELSDFNNILQNTPVTLSRQ